MLGFVVASQCLDLCELPSVPTRDEKRRPSRTGWAASRGDGRHDEVATRPSPNRALDPPSEQDLDGVYVQGRDCQDRSLTQVDPAGFHHLPRLQAGPAQLRAPGCVRFEERPGDHDILGVLLRELAGPGLAILHVEKAPNAVHSSL